MASFFEKLKKGMGIEEPITDFKEEGEEETTNETKIIKKPKRSPKQSLQDATGQAPVVEPRQARFTTGQAKIKKSPKEKKSKEIKTPYKSLPKGEQVPNEAGRDYTGQVKKIEIQTKMPEEEIEEKTIEEMEIENQAEKDFPEEPEEEKEKKWSSFGKGKENKSSSSPFAAALVTEEGQLAIDVYQTEDDLVIQSAIAGVKPENLDISMERDIITIKGSREKPFKEDGDYFSQECFWGLFSREMIMPVEVDPQRAVAEMKNGILTIRIPKILREKKRKIIVRE